MFDSHEHIEGWGILPFIKFGNVIFNTYSVCMLLGLVAGYGLIRYLMKRYEPFESGSTMLIIVSALVGGTLGAKLPIWIAHYHVIFNASFEFQRLLSGRTIVGGFIGGVLGVVSVKKMLGIRTRKGNLFAPGIALGMILGRVGCFLKGCCYGTPSNLLWAVDFGDGILRHPTQIYEILFHGVALLWLIRVRCYEFHGGKYLSLYIGSYMVYRFFSEFLRIHDPIFRGLTSYQIFALLGVGMLVLKEQMFKRKKRLQSEGSI